MKIYQPLSALLLAAATLQAQSVVGTGNLNPSPAESPTWAISGTLSVGNTGTGSLVVTAGGQVTADTIYLGHQAGSFGSLAISGSNSLVRSTTSLVYVGYDGPGSLTVSDHGTLSASNALNLGHYQTGEGTVDGGTLSTGVLRVGVWRNALLTVNSGQVTADSVIELGSENSGSGTLTVTGGTVSSSYFVNIGRYGQGTLNIAGGEVSSAQSIQAGIFANSSGSINLSAGTLKSTTGYLAIGSSGTGFMTMTGGTVDLGDEFRVGDSGIGTLTITHGAITSSLGNIARGAGSSGTVTMSGGTWTNDSLFVIGNEGSGAFTLTGGTVTNVDGEIGRQAGSGVAFIRGGTWTNSGALSIAKGNGSVGFLQIIDNGIVNVAGGTVHIASGTGSVGGISFGYGNIATPTSAGTLNATHLVFGSGTGSIRFNQTNDLTLDAAISGHGTVAQRGIGTTTLTGTSTYSGATMVEGGTLRVEGSLTSDVTVYQGGTLSGSGRVGAITLESGSSLAPGNGFQADALAWHGEALMIFGLGDGESDMLDLTGALTKNGSGAYAFAFRDAGWQVGQTYVLIEFAGTNFSEGDFSFTNDGGFAGGFALDGTTLTFTMTAIPEPSTGVLGLIALAAALLVHRKKRAGAPVIAN